MKTVLSHANLIDCVEPKVRPDSAVLIEDGRIRAILPSGEAGSAGVRSWLRARLDTAPRFCGLEIGNAVPHRRQRGIPKGGRTPSHTPRRPHPSASRGRLAVRLALQAVANRVHLAEPVLRVSVSLYTNPPGAWPRGGPTRGRSLERLSRTVAIGTVRVPVSIQISDRKIMTRWASRCSRPRDDGRVFDFSMGSTFRAIGQSPTRNALVSEIRRDCVFEEVILASRRRGIR